MRIAIVFCMLAVLIAGCKDRPSAKPEMSEAYLAASREYDHAKVAYQLILQEIEETKAATASPNDPNTRGVSSNESLYKKRDEAHLRLSQAKKTLNEFERQDTQRPYP